MIHLSCLLLQLQFRSLFICSIILISFSFSLFCSYSSPNRFSSVNVVLTFNDSLILIAPESPISLPVHLYGIILNLSFHLILSHLSPLISRYVQGATGITLSIFFHSFSVIDQCHSYHYAFFLSFCFYKLHIPILPLPLPFLPFSARISPFSFPASFDPL